MQMIIFPLPFFVYTANTMVLTDVHRGPHQAFYTGVKFVVLAQHPVVLFLTHLGVILTLCGVMLTL